MGGKWNMGYMICSYPEIDVYKTGQRIKRTMLVKGYTVREIQRYLGLASTQSIYHWFDGRNLPSIDNIYALAKLLKVSVDFLLVGKKEEVDKQCDYVTNSRLLIYYDRISALCQAV